MCHPSPRYVKERHNEAEWTRLRIAQDAFLSTNPVDDVDDEDDDEEEDGCGGGSEGGVEDLDGSR